MREDVVLYWEEPSSTGEKERRRRVAITDLLTKAITSIFLEGGSKGVPRKKGVKLRWRSSREGLFLRESSSLAEKKKKSDLL